MQVVSIYKILSLAPQGRILGGRGEFPHGSYFFWILYIDLFKNVIYK
jgi:hypothetical protein